MDYNYPPYMVTFFIFFNLLNNLVKTWLEQGSRTRLEQSMDSFIYVKR